MRTLFTLAVLALFPWTGATQEPAPTLPERRAVLVTGASSGIGRKTTEVLAANGFFVYAGARKDKDLAALNEIEHVQAIRLDVTKQADIDAAVKTVRDAGRGLYALVNNAGVAVVAPLIEMREEDLDFQLDTNVFGPYRVTKAFAPLLIESKGRISTTGSISGTVCWGMGGAYSMSKHAIEAFTDALAIEMEPFGVHVSVIDPGNYRSEIMTNMRQRLVDAGYTGKGSLYENRMERLLESPTDRSEFKEPDEVADAFLHALSDADPKRRYMVVPNRREAELTIRAALTRVAQLNAAHAHSFDRESLIRMLDEALAAQE